MAGLRERQKADRLRRILDVARERFRQEGYDKVTIDTIAADAGVSAVTVYNYYGAKAGLLLALVKESDDLLIAQLRILIGAPPADPREAVAQFAQTLRHHALTYLTKPTWRQVLAASIVEGSADFGRTYMALDRVLIAMMADLVAAYQKMGVIPTAIQSGQLGDTLFAIQNIRFFQFIAEDDLADEAVDSLLRNDLAAIFAAEFTLADAPPRRRKIGQAQ